MLKSVTKDYYYSNQIQLSRAFKVSFFSRFRFSIHFDFIEGKSVKKFVAKANQRISENRNIGKRLKSGHNHWISSTTQCLKIQIYMLKMRLFLGIFKHCVVVEIQ